jgi:DNA invertase Pin-like site-specific DNA recombinase
MVDLIETFQKEKIFFKSLSEPEFDTSSANGLFLLQIFSAVAEFERNLIREPTKVGLDSARRRNKHLGRPKGIPKEMKNKYEYAKHLYDNKNVPILKACKEAGISKASFYRLDKNY